MNKIEVIIAKEALDFLYRTIEQLASKVGIEIAVHGAKGILDSIKGGVREHKPEAVKPVDVKAKPVAKAKKAK